MYNVPPRLLLPGILFLALLVYWPGLSGPFIFDDAAAITANHHLDIDPTVVDEWRTAAVSSNSGRLRRPVSMWSFTVNHVIAGANSAFGIKLGNVLIHLLCGYLIFQLFKVLLQAPSLAKAEKAVVPLALFAAAIWLLNPLHVSTVLYAVQRMAQLSTLFCLLGLVYFARERLRWSRQGASPGEIIAAALWIGLFTLLAVLSKENGLLLLWLIPVVEVVLFRGRWAGIRRPALAWLGWLALIAPLFFVFAVLVYSPGSLIGGYATRDFTLWERVLTQSRLLWTYLWWFVFPNLQAMGFQHDDIPVSVSIIQPATTLLALLCWAFAICIALVFRRRFPLLLFSLLFYLVGHSMESGVIPLEMVYEHRNYLPTVGVALLAGSSVCYLVQLQSAIRPRVIMLSLVIAAGLLTGMRAVSWSDEELLTLVNTSNHPRSARSQVFYVTHHIGQFESLVGTDEKAALQHLITARAHIEAAYRSRDDYFPALVILFWLDSHYFTSSRQHEVWLEELEGAAGRVPLSASVRMALETLVDCFADELCEGDSEAMFDILATFEERFPRSADFPLLRHRYQKRVGRPVQERAAELQRAQDLAPFATRTYRLQLMDQAEVADVSGMYETVRKWMLHDPHRRELQDIKSVFKPPGEPKQVN